MASPRRLLSRILLFCALVAPACAFAQTRIVEVQGDVEVFQSGVWARVLSLPVPLRETNRVRTALRSTATMKLDDGSSVQLGPSALFTVEAAQKTGVQLLLDLGALHLWVKKGLSRRFAVRTPTAVCAVRGTEFQVDVAASHAVSVDVIEGVVAVKTLLGEELELGDGRQLRSLRILPDRPLERPAADAPKQKAYRAPRESRSLASSDELADFKKDAQREVALGLGKDQVQAAAAIEARRAEYQEGKTMVDAFGQRVRIEEYIVRPAADQFKFVVLNERANRFDYFYYQATFNQALPEQLAPALRYLNGKVGTAPDYFITAFETGRSNTIDRVQENGAGGHLVSTTLTQDTVVYDPGSNTFSTVASGASMWKTLFDNYSYKINGTEKFGWSPMGAPNITSYDYVATGIQTRILGGAGAGGVDCLTQACETANRPSAVTQPETADKLHDRVSISYANGTQETYDFYVIGDDGRQATAADFANVSSGATYKNTLLKWNFEQVITASEFQGRKIDLVVEPKILVNSGVIQ